MVRLGSRHAETWSRCSRRRREGPITEFNRRFLNEVLPQTRGWSGIRLLACPPPMGATADARRVRLEQQQCRRGRRCSRRRGDGPVW